MKRTGKLLELGEIPGRTFVCGDIHGCYDDLMQLLADADFEPNDDRLICTGDLIDRGPCSHQCMDLVDEHWFYTCMGNHEDMALQCITNRARHSFGPDHWWVGNGGSWFYGENSDLTKDKVLNNFSDLPVGIEVIVGGKRVVITHADPGLNSWHETKQLLSAMPKICWTDCHFSKTNNPTQLSNLYRAMLWERSRANKEIFIEGCDLMIHGHTIMKEPKRLGNRWFIDTGSFLKYFDGEDGHISLFCLNEIDL